MEEYAFGRLAPPQVAEFEEHLLVCEDCREALVQAEDYIRLMKAAMGKPEAAGARRRRIYGYLAAGSVAAAVAVAVIPNHRTSTPPETVDLVAYRGVEMAKVRAGRPARLRMKVPDLADAQYRVEVVNAAGALVWSGPAQAAGGLLDVLEPEALNSGVHWVRLYSSAGALLREFGLEGVR